MKKKELLARIEALEGEVSALKASREDAVPTISTVDWTWRPDQGAVWITPFTTDWDSSSPVDWNISDGFADDFGFEQKAS